MRPWLLGRIWELRHNFTACDRPAHVHAGQLLARRLLFPSSTGCVAGTMPEMEYMDYVLSFVQTIVNQNGRVHELTNPWTPSERTPYIRKTPQ